MKAKQGTASRPENICYFLCFYFGTPSFKFWQSFVQELQASLSYAKKQIGSRHLGLGKCIIKMSVPQTSRRVTAISLLTALRVKFISCKI